MERINSPYIELQERLNVAKGIIFSDVDGVWLDEQKNFAWPDTDSLEAILKAQDQGYAVILNSDTGGESLLKLSREFGINSDICIAENGAYIQNRNEIIMIQDPDPRLMMTGVRDRLTTTLSQYGNVWCGDATRVIRTGEKTTDAPLFLINTARRCSVGVYARKAGMTVDQGLLDKLYQAAQATLLDIPDLLITTYPTIGSCLVRAKNRPSKADAVSRLLSISGFNGPCFMIGDTAADDMNSLEGRVLNYAVGNATDELKSRADFIESTASIDQSAKAIINFIINS